jgi:PAS domain S-box-containing protein
MPFAAIPDAAALARAIVDTVRDPLLVLDQELFIVAASRAFYQTFQLVDRDVRGRPIYEIEDGQWNIPELRTILETIAKDHTTVEGYQVDRDFPRVGRRIMLLNARKVFYTAAGHTTTLLAFEDVTERRAVEEQVQELLREKDMLLLEMQHRVANSLQIIASILLMRHERFSRRKRACNWRTRTSAFCRLPPCNSICKLPVAARRS